MAIQYLHNIDLNDNEIQNVKLHVTNSAPTAAIGMIYYDSTNNVIKYRDNSGWKIVETTTGDSNTTYTTSVVDSSGIKLRLTGSDASTDDITFAASGTATVTRTDANTITIGATGNTTEQVQDIVGAMTTGNTETGITVTYEDGDGTIDFVVADTTVAGDSGSTGMTPGDTLTIAGGTGITTAMSGDTLTITNSSTNTDVDVSKANLKTRLASMDGTDTVYIGDADDDTTVVIRGTLQVDGTTTTVDSTTVTLNDHNIVLDTGNSTSAVVDGAGITLEGGSGNDVTWMWNASGTAMELKLGSSLTAAKFGNITGTLVTASQTNITGVGAISTGTWEATDVAIAHGGTGQSTALAAFNALKQAATTSYTGVVELATATEAKDGSGSGKVIDASQLGARYVHSTIDVSNGSFTSSPYKATIPHGLGTEDVIVQLFDSSTKETVHADIARKNFSGSDSDDDITITFGVVPDNDIEVIITSAKGSTAKTATYA